MEIGDIVRSERGRDSGQLYLVVGVTTERILVADGATRVVRRPKPKNPKHVRAVAEVGAEMRQRFEQGHHHPGDEEIRQILRAQLKQEGGHADAER